MTRLIPVLLLSLLVGQVHAQGVDDKFIDALITVESGGNDNAVGDTHLADHAYGCLQIRQPVCDDVANHLSRITGRKIVIRAQECLGNRDLSVAICQVYLSLYATEKRLGHKPTAEDFARIWNGGPNGYKKTSTEKYWQKVRRELELK